MLVFWQRPKEERILKVKKLKGSDKWSTQEHGSLH
jgi:hypothetical protein